VSSFSSSLSTSTIDASEKKVEPDPLKEKGRSAWYGQSTINVEIGEEAVKHDDASVPVGYWNRALCGKSHKQEWALDDIRRWSVEKIWRRSITKCFCLWLKSKAARRKSIQLLFQPKMFFDINLDRDFITLKRFEKSLHKFKVVKFRNSDGCRTYEWTRDDLKNY